jgi:GGDEF domain-containing protein
MQGALWSYPVVFLAFFVLPQRSANTIAVALTVMGTLLLSFSQDPGTVWRYVVSMALCFVVINVMLNIVTSLQGRLLQQSITDPLTGAFNRRHMDVTACRGPWNAYRLYGSAGERDAHRYRPLQEDQRPARARRRRRGAERPRGTDSQAHGAGSTCSSARAARNSCCCSRIRASPKPAGSPRRFVKAWPRRPFSRPQPFTVSIGVGETQPNEASTAWMKRIDAALYRAKEEGTQSRGSR